METLICYIFMFESAKIYIIKWRYWTSSSGYVHRRVRHTTHVCLNTLHTPIYTKAQHVSQLTHHYESVLIINPYCILIAVYHIARSPRLGDRRRVFDVRPDCGLMMLWKPSRSGWEDTTHSDEGCNYRTMRCLAPRRDSKHSRLMSSVVFTTTGGLHFVSPVMV